MGLSFSKSLDNEWEILQNAVGVCTFAGTDYSSRVMPMGNKTGKIAASLNCARPEDDLTTFLAGPSKVRSGGSVAVENRPYPVPSATNPAAMPPSCPRICPLAPVSGGDSNPHQNDLWPCTNPACSSYQAVEMMDTTKPSLSTATMTSKSTTSTLLSPS
ncbi:hypothetical protein THAOC_02521, partial [Thalassiosira oceanica]